MLPNMHLLFQISSGQCQVAIVHSSDFSHSLTVTLPQNAHLGPWI